MKRLKRHPWKWLSTLLAVAALVTVGAFATISAQEEPADDELNLYPLPEAEYTGEACAVLLDDIALGGFIRACIGDNGSLGSGSCPSLNGRIGLRIDPDGAAGPLRESEVPLEGTFEERWGIEYDDGGNTKRQNGVFFSQIGGFTQVDSSFAGVLQSTGVVTSPDGRLRVAQIVSLPSGSLCLHFEVTITNVGSDTLTNVEYWRSHDPDQGRDLGLSFGTLNQTINRPLPSLLPPMIVSASVKDFSPVETRTVGLGTSEFLASGLIADVGIRNFGLAITDPDEVLDGLGSINRGPGFRDVGSAIAFRQDTLAPGDAFSFTFCYCFSSAAETSSNDQIAADIVDVFVAECTPIAEPPEPVPGHVTKVRRIDLVPVAGSPFLNRGPGEGQFEPPPSATVTIIDQGGADFVRFDVNGLRPQSWSSNASYALYLTTSSVPTSGGSRYLFNVMNGGFFTQHNQNGAWLDRAPGGITVDTRTITAFIALEPDDGRAFISGVDNNRLVFVGTSVKN